MIHLMKLEVMKIKLGKQVSQILITDLIILALTVLMCYESVHGKDTDDMLTSYTEAIIMTSVLARGAFVIFSSVLMNRLTVDEYRNRTILQLFTYPVKRKKLFAAKLLIVFLFTFILSSVSCLLNNAVLYLFCKSGNLFADTSIGVYLDSVPNVIVGGLMCGLISLIPFYFGMRKKSGAATIISSVIIAIILCNSNGNIADASYMIRLLVAGGFSILVAIYTITVKLNQLESIDL